MWGHSVDYVLKAHLVPVQSRFSMLVVAHSARLSSRSSQRPTAALFCYANAMKIGLLLEILRTVLGTVVPRAC